MALRTKRIRETFEMPVYTDEGDYFGDVEEPVLSANKISGWRIRSTKNSSLRKVLGGAKGVIVPHQLTRAMGDIMIISKTAVPSYEGERPEEEEIIE